MRALSFRLFVFVFIFAPLAFGTVETWTVAIAQGAVTLSFLLLSAAVLRENRSSLSVPGILPLLLLAAWAAFQLLPLPAALVRILSPATFEIYRPLLEVNNGVSWLPLSLHPRATLLAFCQWTTYALFYLLTVYHLSEPGRLKQTVVTVVVLVLLLAVEAILQKLTSPEAIYWFRAAPAGSSPVGPFVYSNQFAGFMEMVFPLVIALFLLHRPRVSYEKGLREKVIAVLTMPGANRYLLLGTGAVLIAVAILLSLSRGGIITLCLAFLLIAFLSTRITPNRQIRWGIVLSVSVILMITWFGWQPIIKEFASLWGKEGLDTSGRLPLLLDGMNIFGAFPLTGSGFGTFRDIYPAYQSLPGEVVYDHAHNDYLELLTDGGLIGFLLAAWFLSSMAEHVTRTLLRRREQYSILITCGALTGIVALLLHCFIDFQLPSGANGLYFFFLCGLAVSGASTRLHYRTRPTLLSKQKAATIRTPALLALTILLCSSWLNSGMLRARHEVSNLDAVYLNQHLPLPRLQAIHDRLAAAAFLDPLAGEYRYRMGNVSTFLLSQEQARQEYLQACRRNPLSGIYLQQLGLALPEGDRHLQDRFLALGVEREPRRPERHLAYARWLLTTDSREQAITVLNKAVLLLPERMADIARFLVLENFSPSELEQILPRKAYAWFELGRALNSVKRGEAAAAYYLKALEYFDIREVQPEYFREPYTLFQRQKNKEQAVAILRQGIRYLPDHAWFRIQLGDYYVEEGVSYRAREEYLQALRLEPNNRELRQKIEKLAVQPGP